MHGVITSRVLMTHCVTILQEFGVRVWCRGCIAVITRNHTTFLAIVFNRNH